jgi:hypothetical protein
MAIRLFAPLVVLALLASGCLQNEPPPPSPPAAQPDCPLAAEPQEGTIQTEIGEYNFSNGASSSYDEFTWDWPTGSLIAMDIRAEWDAGVIGEQQMQLRVAVREEYLDSLAMSYGPSPIHLNFTTTVIRGDLAVIMEPQGVAVNKQGFETKVTMVQTLLCHSSAP